MPYPERICGHLYYGEVDFGSSDEFQIDLGLGNVALVRWRSLNGLQVGGSLLLKIGKLQVSNRIVEGVFMYIGYLDVLKWRVRDALLKYNVLSNQTPKDQSTNEAANRVTMFSNSG